MDRGAPLRVLLVAAALSGCVVAVVAVAEPSGIVTTYAAAAPSAAVAFFTAGLGALAAGVVAAGDRATGSLWVLCVLVSLAWFAPALVGWESGPGFLRSAGMVAAPFLLPLLVHLALTAPTGRLDNARRRSAVVGVYGLAALAGVGLALTRDPFLNVYCWSNCTDNVFLVVGQPTLARSMEVAWLGAAVAIGILTLLGAAWRLVTATAVARALGWATVVPAALAAGAEAAYAAALLRNPAEDPEQDPFGWIFLTRAVALTALAAGVSWYVLQRHRRRSAFVRLVNELEVSPGSGSLQASLSRSFGDGSLTVAYWLSRERRYVDSSGHAAAPGANPPRATTSIVRGGQEVAVISHDGQTMDDETLRHRMGPAALLAIDNERLGAELLAHLGDLRASRARIVAAADDVRRRIERDLHDGAQQRLLAVLYELRLARHDAADDHRRAALDAMIENAQRSLAELRELAHGIFPAILDESGLGPALWTLADQAAVALDIRSVPEARLPAELERTAYLVVTETLEVAPPTACLSVRIDVHDDRVVVGIAGVDVEPTAYLADRVGVSGGAVTYSAGRLSAEIPCG